MATMFPGLDFLVLDFLAENSTSWVLNHLNHFELPKRTKVSKWFFWTFLKTQKGFRGQSSRGFHDSIRP